MKVRDMTDDELVANVDMSSQTQFQAPFLLEMNRRLIIATRAAGDCASTQTTEVIKLTRALRTYTIVLAVLGGVQILLMASK